jgi:hypothetical protein
MYYVTFNIFVIDNNIARNFWRGLPKHYLIRSQLYYLPIFIGVVGMILSQWWINIPMNKRNKFWFIKILHVLQNEQHLFDMYIQNISKYTLHLLKGNVL